MRYINRPDDYEGSKESAVTFGKFDGLHRGHQKLVEKVQELGSKEGINSIVCAFDMRPLWADTGRTVRMLMNGAERRSYLEGKADVLLEWPFDQTFSRIRAEEFIRDIIRGLFHARYVVVGTDFQFGYEKQGDIHMLKEYEKEYGYRLIVIEKERYGGRVISSSYIKEVLRQGDVLLAARLLGYAYGITGKVEHGRKLGRTLGFPTFNVAWPKEKLLPPRGVYASEVLVSGRWYPAISNVGVKPTVSEEERVLIESFLFGYDGDAYGKTVSVRLCEFRRPEQKFDSVGQLKACIDQDIEYGRRFFGVDE
ncbi:MAG: bifunctional riboflavin kinase/FAD synthetase [Lachnospiraceae bacterium]